MISVLWLKELWSYCSDDILKWGCRVSVVCYGGFRGWRMVKGTRNQQKTDRASAVSSELTVDCKHNAISHCRLYLPPYHPVFAIHLLRQGKLHRLSGTAEHLKLSITDLSQVINCYSMVIREYHCVVRSMTDLFCCGTVWILQIVKKSLVITYNHHIHCIMQAVDQLKVVYGMDHPSTHEALELLQTSQVELGHWQSQDR